MPRPSNTEARRAELLDAFQHVLAREGYDGASVKRIAAQAGLTAGLVHYHFANKQALLLGLVERMLANINARAVASVAEGAPRARLRAWIDAILGLGDSADPDLVACWVLIGSEALRRPEVQTIYADAVGEAVHAAGALLAGVLKAEGGNLAKVDAAARTMVNTIEGTFRVAAGAPGILPPGSAADDLYALAEALITAAQA